MLILKIMGVHSCFYLDPSLLEEKCISLISYTSSIFKMIILSLIKVNFRLSIFYFESFSE